MTRTDPIFSLVMPYHNAAGMFARQVFGLYNLSSRLSDHIEMVICDDASDKPPEVPRPFNLFPRVSAYRIPPPHVRWSHRCATNVAAFRARGEWLLITDIDHVPPAETWQALAARHRTGELNPARVYNFRRKNTDGSPKHEHPDSWLIHRSMWRTIGGYDTRYRGHYGQNAAFQDRVKHHAGQVITLYEHLVRYSREDIADASMPETFGRKSDADRRAVADMRAKFHRDGTYYQPGEVVPHVQVYP